MHSKELTKRRNISNAGTQHFKFRNNENEHVRLVFGTALMFVNKKSPTGIDLKKKMHG